VNAVNQSLPVNRVTKYAAGLKLMSLKQLFVGVIFMAMASIAYSIQVTVNDGGSAAIGPLDESTNTALFKVASFPGSNAIDGSSAASQYGFNANNGGPAGSTLPSQAVPEPSTLPLVCVGLLGFAILKRRCN
jgi:hypothetical protein